MSDLFQGTTALITGASRGIGAAFADLLAQRGANLVLVARHADSLHPVAEGARARGVRVSVVPADLARPEAPDAIAEATARAGLTIDHLINNAGLGGSGRFQDLPVAEQLPTIDVNVRALTALAGRFLPGMVQRSRGGLLNIASSSAFQGLQWLPVYSASKAYVVTLSEAIWVGLRGTGVRCCCVSPGPVDTPYFDHNKIDAPPKWAMQSAVAVARAGLRGYERNDCHVLPFLPFRLLAWSTRLVPRALAARLGGWYAAPHDK
ncbi:MAG TPA: SDR family oxidoreductase [Gemmatimonadales bacterium]|jgi:short-subunit dehydrogenase